MNSPAVIHSTDRTFNTDVLQSNTPVLVDFWASWCGPCKLISPFIDELAEEYSDQLKTVKLNVDENSRTASAFGVRGIPTLLLFKNGKVEAQHIGAATKAQLARFVRAHLD